MLITVKLFLSSVATHGPNLVREKVLKGEIEMVPTKTDEQTADILTKSFNKVKFEKNSRSTRHGLQDYFG